MPLTISVIITVFFDSPNLGRAIASVVNQEDARWELIIIAKRSLGTETVRVLEEASVLEAVKIVLVEEQLGLASSRNEGIRRAGGAFVTFLEQEDEFYPDASRKLGNYCGRSGIVITGYDFVDRGGRAGLAFGSWDPTGERDRLFIRPIGGPMGLFLRKDVWEVAGGFDESLWEGVDWDMVKRVARLGVDLVYLPFKIGLCHFDEARRTQRSGPTDVQRSKLLGRVAVGQTPFEARGIRRVERILVATAEALLDSGPGHDGGLLELTSLLTGIGFDCLTLCGSARGRPVQVGFADANELFPGCEGHAGGRIRVFSNDFTREDRVRDSGLSTFARGLESLLEETLPHAVVARSADWERDPFVAILVRLAKRRDIPTVLIVGEIDGDAFAPGENAIGILEDLDYLLANSPSLSQVDWLRLGLACRVLSPPSLAPDDRSIVIEYEQFFRSLHPQPRPPLIPNSLSFTPADEEHQPSHETADFIALVDAGSKGGDGEREFFSDRYKVLRELGRGHMGIVFEAVDLESGAHVAIKTFRSDAEGRDRYFEQFRREMEMLTRLSHPHIVTAIEFSLSSPRPFFSMPLIAGHRLSDVLDELRFLFRDFNSPTRSLSLWLEDDGPSRRDSPRSMAIKLVSQPAPFAPGLVVISNDRVLLDTNMPFISWDEIIRTHNNENTLVINIVNIFIQITSAISYIHGINIVHRDLKPSNILLQREGKAFVSDFGLARLDDESYSSSWDAVIGNPKYTAPERHCGGWDPRSDVYSVGMMLHQFFMLLAPTGGYPRDLELTTLHATADRPEDRFQTMEQFQQKLECCIRDRSLI
jgi:Protein tyrosine and serine/threonine kinase/Glycosyl transferase family 2